MRALLDEPTNRGRGFLAAGHVCTVMGYEEYEPIAARYLVPERRHRFRASRYSEGRLHVRPSARGPQAKVFAIVGSYEAEA
jgi:hypothetical protein